jgi:Amt family ammonium transporter
LSGADYQPQSPDAGYAWIHWFFEWTYAAFAATIVSGALAERASLIGYLVCAPACHMTIPSNSS